MKSWILGTLASATFLAVPAAAQMDEADMNEVIENTKLGVHWSGNVDPAEGSCAIFTGDGQTNLSLYSDKEDPDGYWLFYGDGVPPGQEGGVTLRLEVNGKAFGQTNGKLDTETRRETGPHYQYKFSGLALIKALDEYPDGFFVRGWDGEKLTFALEAIGASEAFAAYKKCNAALR